jgi:hypothetical protein
LSPSVTDDDVVVVVTIVDVGDGITFVMIRR